MFSRKSFPKVLYKEVIRLESLQKALQLLRSQESSLFFNKSFFSERDLFRLHCRLTAESYVPLPKKKSYNFTPNGKKRVFSVASPSDVLIQFALFIHLEPFLAGHWYETAYGIRSGRKSKDALLKIGSEWTEVDWIFKLDLSYCFDTVTYPLLLKELAKFCDQQTVELVGKFLKEGYFDHSCLVVPIAGNSSGILRENPLALVLANLYFHRLDAFVHNRILASYKKEVDSLVCRKHVIRYIRVVDEVLLGFSRNPKEANNMILKIGFFCSEVLRLTLNFDTCSVVSFNEVGISFQGFLLRRFPLYKRITRLTPNYRRKTLKDRSVIVLGVPVKKLLDHAVEKGYAKLRGNPKKSIRASSFRSLTSFKDSTIISHFSAILKSIAVFYCRSNRLSDLRRVLLLYRKSCALTLAEKYKKKTAAAVFNKYCVSFRALSNQISLFSFEKIMSRKTSKP